MIAAAAAMAAGPALAHEGDFEMNCMLTGCHAGTAINGSPQDTPSCAACHYHGMHEKRTRWGSVQSFRGWTDKGLYEAGEIITISVTGGDQPGWVRVRIQDHDGREVARATGPTGMGNDSDPTWTASVLPGPIVLTARAPRVPGTYRWKIGWYGNVAPPNPPTIQSGQAVIAHHHHKLEWRDVDLPEFEVYSNDAAGSSITSLSVSPSPTLGATQLRVSALATDVATGMTPIAGARGRIFIYAGGQNGDWVDFSASDGAFDSEAEQVSAVFDVADLDPGFYSITAQSADAMGNWGASQIVSFQVTAPPPGDLSPPGAECATPNPPVGAPGQEVILRAVLDDRAAGGSPIRAAEAFVDAPGLDGAAIPLTASDGVLDSAREALEVSVPTMDLPEGEYPFLIHGQDASGWWSPYCSSSFEIRRSVDTVGPVATAMESRPTAGAPVAVVHASFSDDGRGNEAIAAGELILDPASLPASGVPMSADDGASNSFEEPMTGVLSVEGWPVGAYQLGIRAMDAGGNWGPVSWISLQVSEGGSDQSGPRIMGLRIGARPGSAPGEVIMTGWIDERRTGRSRPARVEYFLDQLGPVGTGTEIPLRPGRGSRCHALPRVVTRFEARILPNGSDPHIAYPVFVRGMDEHGNWGPLASVAFWGLGNP